MNFGQIILGSIVLGVISKGLYYVVIFVLKSSEASMSKASKPKEAVAKPTEVVKQPIAQPRAEYKVEEKADAKVRKVEDTANVSTENTENPLLAGLRYDDTSPVMDTDMKLKATR